MQFENDLRLLARFFTFFLAVFFFAILTASSRACTNIFEMCVNCGSAGDARPVRFLFFSYLSSFRRSRF